MQHCPERRPQPGRSRLLGQQMSTSCGNASSAVSLMTRIAKNATRRAAQTSATANVSISTARAPVRWKSDWRSRGVRITRSTVSRRRDARPP